MRNTSGPGRGAWATYAKAAREHAMLSKTELSRRLGIDRGTVHRWETGQNRPERADLVHAFAELVGVDTNEALAAAGLRPTVEPPTEPTVQVDDAIQLVNEDPKLTPKQKMQIIARLLELEAQDRERRKELARWMVEQSRSA